VVGTLSGGEQQMCAIGRALMSIPKLMIIDELSLGLALVVADRILDRGYVLRQGSIFKSGPAAELAHAYIRSEYLRK
jgi:ABC-type branched-subunit amino acid transport system ATPase component